MFELSEFLKSIREDERVRGRPGLDSFLDLLKKLNRDIFGKDYFSKSESKLAVGFFQEFQNSSLPKEPITQKRRYVLEKDQATRKAVVKRAAAFVKKVRSFYFGTEVPLLRTQKEAHAWIKKNINPYLFKLGKVVMPKNPDLTEDVKELANATGWRENETLMHLLTGKTPSLVKFQVRVNSFNYAAPLPLKNQNDLLSRKWVTIEVNSVSLNAKNFNEAYLKARQILQVAKKKDVKKERLEEFLFIEGNIKKVGRKWVELSKLWKDHSGESIKPDTLRMNYDRTKKKLVKRNLA